MEVHDQPHFSFPVEQGKVREFLQATLPLLHAAGLPDIGADGWIHRAPTVFSRVADFHQPEGGSLADLMDSKPPRLRHAGHRWHVRSPLRIGETYRVVGWRVLDSVEKQGRDGLPFRLVTAERSFLDQHGVEVLQEQGIIAVLGPREAASALPTLSEAANEPCEPTRWNADWRNAAVGTELADITVPRLGLTDIVRFAGAIGDFNPIHHDPAAARASGLPDIIAMGMLACTLASLAVEQACGAGMLASLSVRFREPLFAERPLRLRITATAEAGSGPAVAIEGMSGSVPILSMTASARP